MRRRQAGSPVFRLRCLENPTTAAGVGLAVFLVAGAISGLVAVSPAMGQECLDCHDEASAVADSAHGFLDCVDCHPAQAAPHDEGLSPEQAAAPPECESCHDDAVADFKESVHGRAILDSGESWLAGCVSCHGPAHDLKVSSAADSPVSPTSLPETCGSCHADPDKAELYRLRAIQPMEAYLSSVHAQAVAEGLEGASCGACHGNHLILPASDTRSSVNRTNVPDTCGHCHGDITATWKASIHGQAAALGIRESPVCTDCHGEHRILSPTRKDSPVFASNIPRMTCGRCHGDLRLAEKFGLSTESVPAYEDSYHGLVSRAGGVGMAQCASCHGVHDILPSSDPASHVNRANLSETCGQCHPGAGQTFSIGPVHVLPTEREHRAVFLIRQVYLWLIFLTIGGMLLHNGLDFLRKLRSRPVAVPGALADAPERMSRAFRLQHGLLAVSFIVLSYTGFALKFPESWWAAPLLQWEDTFGFRGILHRAAALVMIGSFVMHAVHVIRNRAARACIRDMMPNAGDWKELIHRFSYLLGMRPDPPRSEWLGYGEKAEYLAVVWGTVVMSLTGIALWLETFVLRWLPNWVPDVATVVHYYEAILAGLAILVWHFYAVIFDPVVYPMDTAWLTGRSAPGRAAEREYPEEDDAG
jgi:cytochrome b subunit of formate dehydrogenase